MKTTYDFITMALFAGLIVLFLQRSMAAEQDTRPLWQYIAPAILLALADVLGNREQHVVAIAILAAFLAIVAVMLKPFGEAPRQ